MTVNWIDLVGAGLSGGVVVKALDYIYQEFVAGNSPERRADANKKCQGLRKLTDSDS